MVGHPRPAGGDRVEPRDVLPRLEVCVGHSQLDEPAADPGGRGVVRTEPVEIALLDAALVAQKHDGIRYVPFRQRGYIVACHTMLVQDGFYPDFHL